nr:response regulator [uncultured Desulfobacter sp.]
MQSILIVDDLPENIDVLRRVLENDYFIMVAPSGAIALEIAEKRTPDLILLDIMMPDMDGYDVCRKLKAGEKTKNTPIIFVTAKSEMEAETKGFGLGAVDYISKPIKPAVVKARVRTHMELKMHRDHMEALAQERARQLVHAERLSTLGTLSAGVAHEINNPLTFISSNADMIKDELQRLRQSLTGDMDVSHLNTEEIASRVAQCQEMVEEVIIGAQRITTLTGNMRHFSRRDDHQKAVINLVACIETARNLCHSDLKRIQVNLDADSSMPPVKGNRQQIEQVLINLFRNAADAMASVKRPQLNVVVKENAGNVQISIADNGPGITEDAFGTIWDAFYTTKGPEKGTGLGLSISKGIIEEHGGRIQAENRMPNGACFVIELPRAHQNLSSELQMQLST